MKLDEPRSSVTPENILIRPLTVDDVGERYVSWLNDPETNKYLEVRLGVPHTINSVKSFVQDCVESKRIHLGIFVAGVHVGNITCSPDFVNRHSSIAFLIGDNKYRGLGLAKLAISGVLTYLFQTLGIHRVEASAYSTHEVSLGLMKSLGFQEEGIRLSWFRSLTGLLVTMSGHRKVSFHCGKRKRHELVR